MSSTAVDGIFGSVFWQLLPHPQKSVHGSLLYLHLQLPPLHPLVHLHDTNWTTESGATGVLLVRGTYCPSIFIQLHSFGSLMSIVSLINVEFCLIWWKARSTCCWNAPLVGGILSLFTFSLRHIWIRFWRSMVHCGGLENLLFEYPKHTSCSSFCTTSSVTSFFKLIRASSNSSFICGWSNVFPQASLLISLNFTASQTVKW